MRCGKQIPVGFVGRGKSLPSSALLHFSSRPRIEERYRLCEEVDKTWKRRHLSIDALSTILTPPAVFTGLLLTLWAYKCLMMVIFQNKIIYMPSVPPFSRAEKVEDYVNQCRPIKWDEHRLRSADGTALKLLESRVSGDLATQQDHDVKMVVIFFQGNASSLPPRLPYLSQVLKAVNAALPTHPDDAVRMIALSYRGFWTSGGRPSQTGIEMDAAAALQWVLQRYGCKTKIMLWGQSIGSGVAVLAAADLLRKDSAQFDRICGLLLETPFVDLRAILVALYPQKWLPYRYLAPFLRSTWESHRALEAIGSTKSTLQVLLLQAGDDEIVPDGQARALEETCASNGICVERQVIPGALHQDIMMKSTGRRHLVRFIASFIRG